MTAPMAASGAEVVPQSLLAFVFEPASPPIEHLTTDAVVPACRRDAPSDFLSVTKYRSAMPDLALLLSIPDFIRPEDFAGTMLYLVSDASKFTTGQTVVVDGGRFFMG